MHACYEALVIYAGFQGSEHNLYQSMDLIVYSSVHLHNLINKDVKFKFKVKFKNRTSFSESN